MHSIDWCKSTAPGHQSRPRSAFRLAVASFTEDYRNRIAVVGLQDERVLVEDDYTDYPDFVTLVEANHGYPATNLQWQPANAAGFPWTGKAPGAELLATTSDALRVWEYVGDAPLASSAYVGRQPSGGGHRLTLKTALSGVSALTRLVFLATLFTPSGHAAIQSAESGLGSASHEFLVERKGAQSDRDIVDRHDVYGVEHRLGNGDHAADCT